MAERPLSPDDYVYMPLADVHKATGIVQHIAKHWWSVHPERGLLFFPYKPGSRDLSQTSPQCNQNEAIVRRLVPAFAEVRFIESVLKPVDPRDYL